MHIVLECNVVSAKFTVWQITD